MALQSHFLWNCIISLVFTVFASRIWADFLETPPLALLRWMKIVKKLHHQKVSSIVSPSHDLQGMRDTNYLQGILTFPVFLVSSLRIKDILSELSLSQKTRDYWETLPSGYCTSLNTEYYEWMWRSSPQLSCSINPIYWIVQWVWQQIYSAFWPYFLEL